MSVPSVSNESIEELRTNFLNDLRTKGTESKYFIFIARLCTKLRFSAVHPKDLERIKSDDYLIERFLLHHKNDVNKSLEMMWASVTWRKQNNINGMFKNGVKMSNSIAY